MSESPEKKKKQRTPSQAALLLTNVSSEWAALCRIIDDAPDDLEPAVIAYFKEMQLDVAKNVDRVIAIVSKSKTEEDYAEGMRAMWASVRDRLKAARATVDKVLLEHIKAHPDVPLRGETGEIKTRAHGGEQRLLFDHEIQFEEKTVRHVISGEVAFRLGIDQRFIKAMYYTALNTDAIRTALKAGEKLDWVKFDERGVGLSYPKPKATAGDVVEVEATHAD